MNARSVSAGGAVARRSAQQKHVETLVKDRGLISRRHEQICDAALKLFSRKGFHQTSVREIAEASGLPIGTLYTYIKTKEDILYLIYRRIFGIFQERMLGATDGIEDPSGQLKAALEATLKIYDEFRDVVLLLYQESHALGRHAVQSLLEVDRSYVSFFRQILEKGARRGQFTVKDANFIAIALLFLCAVWALKRWNLKGYALPEVIEHLDNLIMHGIASR